ncbi:protein kinase [Frankia sp. AgB1.9]|uniref:serine/threonine-protein kinase n=1 Tax=unclassified Frankia TaxID=2632575 RepID=UPI0019341AAA|nr:MULTISPECIES: serine/threonine-protein kinase [unclassified Frankia]MBL7488906.1 protein kinase [Frankia sp. AgW1.1]MBL7546747.1 protein kinase [Frankia sp. AgB1.9]MBL7621841.1 protein kinase [Frankia sp. AgB1.8]
MIVDRGRVTQALPGYVLGEKLGSGAFGLVLAGTHRQLGRPVAIKVMETTSTAASFAAEARVLARLDHPHIVRVYDYVEDHGLSLVVMELLAGGTLTGQRAVLSPEQICAVALAIAAALEHAHRHKVLHRDIKAENVMFASDGTLKVTDFGVAKLMEGVGTTSSGVAGTPAYMAPEQIEGGQLGPWTDLYALGIVLYRLFTGRLPFDPKLPLLALLSHQLTRQPPPMDGVAAPLAEVVSRLLAKSPGDRPPDAATFALELATAATTVFGVGWAALGPMPLHLDDVVRAATERPADRAAVALVGRAEPATPEDLAPRPLSMTRTGSATLVPSQPPARLGEPPFSAGPRLPPWESGEGSPVPTASPDPSASGGSAPETSGLLTEIPRGGEAPSADGSGEKPPADQPSGARARRRRRRRRERGAWIVGGVVLVLVVAAAVLAPSLSPGSSPRPPEAQKATTVLPDTGPAAGTPRSPSATPIRSVDATIPPSSPGMITTLSAATTNAGVVPTAYSIDGINGGDDTTQVPGSEADTYWVGNDATCSAWLDDNGSGALAGVLNTSLTQSCVAELFRSDASAYTFSASWGAKKTNFIPVGGSTMWICVWHADLQSTTEVCSPHFGMNGRTPVRR